jgi:hypothetical protein
MALDPDAGVKLGAPVVVASALLTRSGILSLLR